jgi:hypothetical protein
MRVVTRFRSHRFRSFVMPLLLAALVLRVLVPTDAVHSQSMSVASSLCSTDPVRSEFIEIPAEPSQPHCDRCLLTPPFDTPFAFLGPVFGPALQLPLLPEQVSQVPEFPLARAQAARAPPRA